MDTSSESTQNTPGEDWEESGPQGNDGSRLFCMEKTPLQTYTEGAEEMKQWLGALAAPTEDPS